MKDNDYEVDYSVKDLERKEKRKRLVIGGIGILLIIASIFVILFLTGVISFSSDSVKSSDKDLAEKKEKEIEKEENKEPIEEKKDSNESEEKKDESTEKEKEDSKKSDDAKVETPKDNKNNNSNNNTPSITYLDGGDKFVTECYTYDSVQKNVQFIPASYAMKGDKIVCFVSYEVQASDPIKSYSYTISYNGLKLIKEDVGVGVKNGNAYSFNLSKPSSVGLHEEEFTFEVTSNDNISFEVKDIKYVTNSNKNYKATNKKVTFTYVWKANNSLFKRYTLPYNHSAFSINCYTYDSYKANKWIPATNIKVGDKIACEIGHETAATDIVKTFKWTIETGNGLKFYAVEVDENSEQFVQDNNSYTYFYSKPTPVGDNVGMYIFEATSTNDLRIIVKDIKFITTDNNFYYNDTITKTLK